MLRAFQEMGPMKRGVICLFLYRILLKRTCFGLVQNFIFLKSCLMDLEVILHFLKKQLKKIVLEKQQLPSNF